MKKAEQNEARIRAAMERLLAGTPLHTDGKLHVKNLASEAGLTRQQVYRSEALSEFNEHLARLRERSEAPTEPHLRRIRELQEALSQEKERAKRYRSERDEAKVREAALANRLLALDREAELREAPQR